MRLQVEVVAASTAIDPTQMHLHVPAQMRVWTHQVQAMPWHGAYAHCSSCKLPRCSMLRFVCACCSLTAYPQGDMDGDYAKGGA